MKRREAREKAFQFLFQIDFIQEELLSAATEYLKEQEDDKFLQNLVLGSVEKKTKLDESIKLHLENWTLNRLPSVERTILRLATYEFLFIDDIPSSVTINEAVELGNTFGDEKSGKFINGVLSKMIK